MSKVAYSYTQKLAFYFDAGITVVHIYQNQFPFLRGKFDLQRTVNETQKEDTGEDQWNNEINKARSFTDEMSSKEYEDITIDYIVTDGVPSEELLDIQRKNDIDLVVMGIRRHNFRDKLFGNTT